MKKSILILSIAAFCFSCGGGADKNGGTTATASNPDVEKGGDLVNKADCKGCHQITTAMVGPAFNQIGQKYENNEANINLLAEKIQKGGSGNWGQVPMAAHSDISKETAVLMAKYVLSLKNEK